MYCGPWSTGDLTVAEGGDMGELEKEQGVQAGTDCEG